MSESNSWCTIESDPGVFTELIEKIGVKDVQFEELWNLEVEDLKKLEPIYGLIFLFKWDSSIQSQAQPAMNADHIYFAKQVINNACATQAIASILLNCADVEIGETLSDFKSFTAQFPPDMRGLALSNCEPIREAHNSFARPEPFVFSGERTATKDDDVFHFVSFLPIAGRLYELDGLAAGPIDHGACSADTWLATVVPIIQQRIAKYSSSQIKFNLLAMIKNRVSVLQSKLEALPAENESERNEIAAQIDMEKEKRRAWQEENVRRRHNYIPFIMSLLELLAKKNELPALIDAAKRKQDERAEAQKKAKTSDNK